MLCGLQESETFVMFEEFSALSTGILESSENRVLFLFNSVNVTDLFAQLASY